MRGRTPQGVEFIPVATGSTDGVPWILEAGVEVRTLPLPPGLDLPESRMLRIRHPEAKAANSSGWQFQRGEVIHARSEYFYLPDGCVSPRFVIGIVARGMPSVRFDAESGQTYPTRIYDIPGDERFQALIVEGTDVGRGQLVALAGSGKVVDEHRVTEFGRYQPRDWDAPTLRAETATESGPVVLEVWDVPDGWLVHLRHPEAEGGSGYGFAREPVRTYFLSHTAKVHNPGEGAARPPVIFGHAPVATARIALVDPDGSLREGQLFEVPGGEIKAYVIPHDAPRGGQVVAWDAEGTELRRDAEDPRIQAPPNFVELAASDPAEATSWRLSAGIVLGDVIAARLEGSALDKPGGFAHHPLRDAQKVELFGHMLGRDGRHFALGVVAKEVERLQVRLDDGTELELPRIAAPDLPNDLFMAIVAAPRWATSVQVLDADGGVVDDTRAFEPTRAMQRAREELTK